MTAALAREIREMNKLFPSGKEVYACEIEGDDIAQYLFETQKEIDVLDASHDNGNSTRGDCVRLFPLPLPGPVLELVVKSLSSMRGENPELTPEETVLLTKTDGALFVSVLCYGGAYDDGFTFTVYRDVDRAIEAWHKLSHELYREPHPAKALRAALQTNVPAKSTNSKPQGKTRAGKKKTTVGVQVILNVVGSIPSAYTVEDGRIVLPTGTVLRPILAFEMTDSQGDVRRVIAGDNDAPTYDVSSSSVSVSRV